MEEQAVKTTEIKPGFSARRASSVTSRCQINAGWWIGERSVVMDALQIVVYHSFCLYFQIDMRDTFSF